MMRIGRQKRNNRAKVRVKMLGQRQAVKGEKGHKMCRGPGGLQLGCEKVGIPHGLVVRIEHPVEKQISLKQLQLLGAISSRQQTPFGSSLKRKCKRLWQNFSKIQIP